jgi:hypothetical protein
VFSVVAVEMLSHFVLTHVPTNTEEQETPSRPGLPSHIGLIILNDILARFLEHHK